MVDYVLGVYVRSRLDIRPRSIEQLLLGVKSFSAWLGHSATLADLTEANLLDFLREYGRSHADPTTNSKRRILLQIWRDAYRRKKIDTPPPEIPTLRERLPMPRALTIEEVSRLIRSAREETGRIDGIAANLWFVSLFLCLLDTGARIGAMLLTEQADVRLEEPAGVMLRSEFSKVKRPEWRPIHPQTVDVFRMIWWPQRKLVWPWPYHRSWLEERFRQIACRARVAHGKGHGGLLYLFRRTSGTLVAMNGGDGSRQLGNGADVFAKYYFDQRLGGQGQLQFIPRPKF